MDTDDGWRLTGTVDSRWLLVGAVLCVCVMFGVAAMVGIARVKASQQMWSDCVAHHPPANCKTVLKDAP